MSPSSHDKHGGPLNLSLEDEHPDLLSQEERDALSPPSSLSLDKKLDMGGPSSGMPSFTLEMSEGASAVKEPGVSLETVFPDIAAGSSGHKRSSQPSSDHAAGSSSASSSWGGYAGSGGGGTPAGGGGSFGVGWSYGPPDPPRPWRKRHPILFWGGLILLAFFIFSAGRWLPADGMIRGPKIAVVNVEGMILDASAGVAWMDTLLRDESVKGVVVRVNSPGGAVTPSQELYRAVKRLSEKKSVVVSMGALAASGGYYLSLGATEIYANPSTLTASIGVRMQIPNMQGLMNTIGVSEKTLTTGSLKDAGSSWRPMTAAEEAYFQAIIDDMYKEFLETVARERGLTLEQARPLADGRAMTGRQALAVKLVDKIGDFKDAVTRVKELAGYKADDVVNVVEGPEKPTSMLRDLLSSALNLTLEQKASLEQPLFLY